VRKQTPENLGGGGNGRTGSVKGLFKRKKASRLAKSGVQEIGGGRKGDGRETRENLNWMLACSGCLRGQCRGLRRGGKRTRSERKGGRGNQQNF